MQKKLLYLLIKTDKHPVSNKLEEAYSRVTDLYVKHQRNWDNADSVEIIKFNDDNEMDDNDMQALFDIEKEEDRSDIKTFFRKGKRII
jgi:hypothetical protein